MARMFNLALKPLFCQACVIGCFYSLIKLKNMIHQKIEKLIPFISEEFITYPLWEEGKYIPFVNIWIKVDNEEEINEFDFKCKEIFKNTGYKIVFDDCNFSETILKYQVHPNFKDLSNGSYKFTKNDWSIEEMLDLLEVTLK